MKQLSHVRPSWSSLALGLAALVPISISSVADAAVVFSADTGNTTLASNVVGTTQTDLPVLAGTAGALTFSVGPQSFSNASFASTDDINTLLGAGSLVSTDTVTINLTVDGITGGAIRSNGVIFGVAGQTIFGGGGPTETLFGQLVANGGNIVAGGTDTGSDVVETSLLDGFSISLTADSAGYSFTFSDIIVEGTTDTSLTAGGAFAGTEFVDSFGDGHFYTSLQRFNGADPVAAISVATIDVTSVPEPSSLALLCVSGLMVVRRRRRQS